MDLSKVERPLVFFHSPCRDGFCAAWLAAKKWKDAQLVPVNYGDGCPWRDMDVKKRIEVADRDVLVLDFSWPRVDLADLRSRARSLLVLDHHVSAQRDLEGLEDCVFDMKRSGAGLALDYFFPNARTRAPLAKIPAIALYCEDRDIWAWKLPRSKEVNCALEIYPMTIEAWDGLPETTTLGDQGAAMLRFKQAEIDRLVESAALLTLPEGAVLEVNTPLHQSEVGHTLALKSPSKVALLWYRDSKGLYRCSFRSADDGPDVSVWAKARGGGGHAKAAGFEMKTPPVSIDARPVLTAPMPRRSG
jgi:hypothetical protein